MNGCNRSLRRREQSEVLRLGSELLPGGDSTCPGESGLDTDSTNGHEKWTLPPLPRVSSDADELEMLPTKMENIRRQWRGSHWESVCSETTYEGHKTLRAKRQSWEPKHQPQEATDQGSMAVPHSDFEIASV